MALSRGTGLGGSGLSDGLPNLGGSGGEDRFDPTASFAPGANSAWDFINNYARFKDVYYGPLANTPGWSFTRASTGYAQTAAGVLVPFASGELRRTDKGVLIEGARTNLCLQSQTFDNASWTKTNATITANTSAAPDGTITADTLTDDATLGQHSAYSAAFSATSGTVYCGSVFAKQGTDTRIQIRFGSGAFSGVGYANFDLSAGTVSATGGTVVASGITALAGGWYRCCVALTATSTVTELMHIQRISSGSAARAESYSGSSTTVYIWGAQLEAASFASSYIPTTTASATRAADVLSVTGITGLNYPASLYTEAVFPVLNGAGILGCYAQLDNGGTGDRILAYGSPGSNDGARIYHAAGSVNQALVSTGTLANNTVMKMVGRCATNSIQVAANGALATEDTSLSVPATPARVLFGRESASDTTALFGYLRRVAVWPRALTDAELQAVTT